MSAPVLFLDFDGVLNHRGTKTRFTFPEGARFTGLDPENVERLNTIMERVPGLRIVVSSTWRLSLDRDGLREALAGAGFRFPERVIGLTPRWRTGAHAFGLYEKRGHEIQAWIDEQADKPSAIAILDDAEDMAHLVGFLVRTDFEVGLQDADVEAVVEKLTATVTRAA